MSKKNRQAVRDSLASALEPPRKPVQKSALDSLLNEYDDGQPIRGTNSSSLTNTDRLPESSSLPNISSLPTITTQIDPGSDLIRQDQPDQGNRLPEISSLPNNEQA